MPNVSKKGAGLGPEESGRTPAADMRPMVILKDPIRGSRGLDFLIHSEKHVDFPVIPSGKQTWPLKMVIYSGFTH